MKKSRNELGDEYLKDLAVQTPANAVRIKNFSGPVKNTTTDSLISYLSDALGKNSCSALGGKQWLGESLVIARLPGFLFLPTIHIWATHNLLYGMKHTWNILDSVSMVITLPEFHLDYSDKMTFAVGASRCLKMTIADFFTEEINDDGKVKYKGEWVDMHWRKELIKVKGQTDEEIIIPVTPHGNIINDILNLSMKSKPTSLWWLINHDFPIPHYKLPMN